MHSCMHAFIHALARSFLCHLGGPKLTSKPASPASVPSSAAGARMPPKGRALESWRGAGGAFLPMGCGDRAPDQSGTDADDAGRPARRVCSFVSRRSLNRLFAFGGGVVLIY